MRRILVWTEAELIGLGIHADSTESAVEQLAMLVLEGGTNLGRTDVHHYARQSIDLFVQLGRIGGIQTVEAIMFKG